MSARAWAESIEQTWSWRTICLGQRYPDAVVRLRPEMPRDRLMAQEILRWSVSDDSGRLRFRFDYELVGTWHGQAPTAEGTGGASPLGKPGGDILPNVFNTRGEFRQTARNVVGGTVERMQVSWRAGTVDVDLGRQPVSLGTSHFVGVLDILAPLSPGYLDGTFKPGIDTLRLHTRSGRTGEAELIFAPAASQDERALLGRLRRTVRGIDIETVAGRFRRRDMLGVGWEGEKRGWNLWGEAAAFSRRPDVERRRAGPAGYARSVVAGVERQVQPLTRAGLAFFHQDFGVEKPADLPVVLNEAPFRERWSYLGGRRYLVGTVNREMHPLVHLDLAMLVNACDGSVLWQPKIAFDTGDDSDLTLFAWLGVGADPAAGPEAPLPRSEFGSAPDGIGFISRWFF